MNIYYHCAKYQICFQKCRYMTFFRLNHWTISKLPVCIFSWIFCIIFVLVLGSDIFFVYNGPIICNSGGGGICFCFLKNTLLVLADKNISALVSLVHQGNEKNLGLCWEEKTSQPPTYTPQNCKWKAPRSQQSHILS